MVARAGQCKLERFTEPPAGCVVKPAVDAERERDLREIDVTRKSESAAQRLPPGRFVLVVVYRVVAADTVVARVVERRIERHDTRVERVGQRDDLERRAGGV